MPKVRLASMGAVEIHFQICYIIVDCKLPRLHQHTAYTWSVASLKNVRQQVVSVRMGELSYGKRCNETRPRDVEAQRGKRCYLTTIGFIPV